MSDREATTRALMVLTVDLRKAAEATERARLVANAIALKYGVELSEPHNSRHVSQRQRN